jgi:uncharacterized membrane protein required for colicin V production
MAFWIGILVAVICASYATKKGFYETWVTLFNIAISVYLAIYLRPVIADIAALGDTPYGSFVTVLGTAGLVFIVLYGISFTFFTGQFKIAFPRVFNTGGAGLFGFLTGYLVWHFLCLLVGMTPFSDSSVLELAKFKDHLQTSKKCVAVSCNLVNALSFQDKNNDANDVITQLLKVPQKDKDITKSAPAETESTTALQNSDTSLPSTTKPKDPAAGIPQGDLVDSPP